MKKQVTREEIEQTEVFLALDKTKQQFVCKKDNINWIKQNFTIASNIGYDKWLTQCGKATEINKSIIYELLN